MAFTQRAAVHLPGAAAAGYVFNNKIEVSARYQTGGSEGSSVSIFGLRVGYNFSLGGAK